MKPKRAGLAGLLVMLVAGCAQWSSTPPVAEIPTLPLPKLAPDSVVLEVTFVRIPEERADFCERFWAEADEAVLPPELRRRLLSNGFRCGLIGATIPAPLREILDQQPISQPGMGIQTTDPGQEVAARTHRMRSRQGHPGKLLVRANPVEKVAALTQHEDGRVSGESLDQAQFSFSVTSYPQGDGQVKVELLPTIEYGQPRSRYRGENGAWMIDNTSREVKVFDDLRVETLLAPGSAVALTCTDAERGLGEQFFGVDRAEKLPRLLLVVRLQQTQLDDRFDQPMLPESVAAVADQ